MMERNFDFQTYLGKLLNFENFKVKNLFFKFDVSLNVDLVLFNQTIITINLLFVKKIIVSNLVLYFHFDN
jgi:hypothetical protein